ANFSAPHLFAHARRAGLSVDDANHLVDKARHWAHSYRSHTDTGYTMRDDEDVSIAELAAAHRQFVRKFQTDQDAFMKAEKERGAERDQKQGELQARLSAIEQKQVRLELEGAARPISAYYTELNKGIEALIAGMADATNARVTLPFSVRAALTSDAPG